MKKENMIIKAFNNHLFNQNKRQKEQGDNTFFLFILKGKNVLTINGLFQYCKNDAALENLSVKLIT